MLILLKKPSRNLSLKTCYIASRIEYHIVGLFLFLTISGLSPGVNDVFYVSLFNLQYSQR